MALTGVGGELVESDAVQLDGLADRLDMAGLDVWADELRWIAMDVRDHIAATVGTGRRDVSGVPQPVTGSSGSVVGAVAGVLGVGLGPGTVADGEGLGLHAGHGLAGRGDQ